MLNNHLLVLGEDDLDLDAFYGIAVGTDDDPADAADAAAGLGKAETGDETGDEGRQPYDLECAGFHDDLHLMMYAIAVPIPDCDSRAGPPRPERVL